MGNRAIPSAKENMAFFEVAGADRLLSAYYYDTHAVLYVNGRRARPGSTIAVRESDTESEPPRVIGCMFENEILSVRYEELGTESVSSLIVGASCYFSTTMALRPLPRHLLELTIKNMNARIDNMDNVNTLRSLTLENCAIVWTRQSACDARFATLRTLVLLNIRHVVDLALFGMMNDLQELSVRGPCTSSAPIRYPNLCRLVLDGRVHSGQRDSCMTRHFIDFVLEAAAGHTLRILVLRMSAIRVSSATDVYFTDADRSALARIRDSGKLETCDILVPPPLLRPAQAVEDRNGNENH